MNPQAVIEWHKIVQQRDPALLDALLADDVVFLSPIVHHPQVGKELTKTYLTAAIHVLDSRSFSYVGQWFGTDSAVLEFVTTIDGIEINGADFITWNEDDRIVQFKVMVRPLKAINLLHQLMAAQLDKSKHRS